MDVAVRAPLDLMTLTDIDRITADYQHIANPAYNADRGPVHSFSGRLHGEF